VTLQTINPLRDGRWEKLVAEHPSASVFHLGAWLEALARTYGYEPMVLTSARDEQPLCNGIVLCRVASWITGTRLVSLPFSDHCDPLLNDGDELPAFVDWLVAECDRQKWKYIELRPRADHEKAVRRLSCRASFCFHTLDLTQPLAYIFDHLHRDSIQRRILRAEKSQMSYERGRSEQLLGDFYRLLVITRKRHYALPQPRAWFTNLIQCMGDRARVMIARHDGIPVAGMLTLQHRSSVVYKYGCSDERFHFLGAMPWLFWKLIEESKATGATEIDFGRSDLENEGLIAFKDRFGTMRRSLSYFRYPHTDLAKSRIGRHLPSIRRVSSILPGPVLAAAGGLLYKHMG
jgi:CelD/BcsL family acetyltransferase involved in cellulose biosynthesis